MSAYDTGATAKGTHNLTPCQVNMKLHMEGTFALVLLIQDIKSGFEPLPPQQTQGILKSKIQRLKRETKHWN